MTRDEAARLLNVKPNAMRGEVDKAFTSLRLHYVISQQLSTDPLKRDAAVRAIGLLQEAYVTMSGQSPDIAMPPPKSAPPIASDDIPRVTLGGRRVDSKRSTGTSPKSAGQSKWEWRLQFRWPILPALWSSNRETAVAKIICAVVFLLAILMLALSR